MPSPHPLHAPVQSYAGLLIRYNLNCFAVVTNMVWTPAQKLGCSLLLTFPREEWRQQYHRSTWDAHSVSRLHSLTNLHGRGFPFLSWQHCEHYASSESSQGWKGTWLAWPPLTGSCLTSAPRQILITAQRWLAHWAWEVKLAEIHI